MNKHQAPKIRPASPRRLPVTELRPGATVTLAHTSPETRVLPQTVGQCVGGSYATVTEAENFGDDVRVRVSHNGKTLTFVVPGTQRVIARMPEATPVPFTPLGWAVLLGLPGAKEMAVGTSYAAA